MPEITQKLDLKTPVFFPLKHFIDFYDVVLTLVLFAYRISVTIHATLRNYVA